MTAEEYKKTQEKKSKFRKNTVVEWMEAYSDYVQAQPPTPIHEMQLFIIWVDGSRYHYSGYNFTTGETIFKNMDTDISKPFSELYKEYLKYQAEKT